MNAWSRRRKRIISLIVFVALIVLVGLPSYFLLYRAPTCTDGRLNGTETGVDCGGSCQLICTAESLPLIVKGDPQVLKVADNIFEVVALVENPNASADVYRAGYIFKIYNAASSTPIKVIEGDTYVPKGMTFAVFEGPFNMEEVGATRAAFEWKTESLVWRKNDTLIPQLAIRDLNFSGKSTRPRLTATIENSSLENVSNIDLVSVIYDQDGNVSASSRTFLDFLPAGGSAPITYTWPRPF